MRANHLTMLLAAAVTGNLENESSRRIRVIDPPQGFKKARDRKNTVSRVSITEMIRRCDSLNDLNEIEVELAKLKGARLKTRKQWARSIECRREYLTGNEEKKQEVALDVVNVEHEGISSEEIYRNEEEVK